MPLNQAIVGDVVCFRDDDGLPDAPMTQIVTQADIEGINNLIRKKRAWATHSLIGYSYEPGMGLRGRRYPISGSISRS